MTERETIHDTEYVDRALPTIIYEKVAIRSMTESEHIHISVSDKTSKGALSTFRALREEVKEDG